VARRAPGRTDPAGAARARRGRHRGGRVCPPCGGTHGADLRDVRQGAAVLPPLVIGQDLLEEGGSPGHVGIYISNV